MKKSAVKTITEKTDTTFTFLTAKKTTQHAKANEIKKYKNVLPRETPLIVEATVVTANVTS